MSQNQNTSNEYLSVFIKFFLIGLLLGTLGFIQEIIFDWTFLLEWLLYVGILACGLLVGLIGVFIVYWGKRQRKESLTKKPLLEFRKNGFTVFKENIFGVHKGYLIIVAYVVQAPKFPQPAIAVRIPHQFKVTDNEIVERLKTHYFFRNKIEIHSSFLTYYAVYNFKKPSYNKLMKRINIILEEMEKSERKPISKFGKLEVVQWLYIPNTSVENLSATH